MAKTLLINCYLNSTEINELRQVTNKFSPSTVISYEKITSDYKLGQDIGALVISGSEARIVKASDKSKFGGVMALIESCRLPILGICFGHQLLCSVFGAKTATLPQPILDQFEEVNVVQSGDIFARFKQEQAIPLAQYHDDYVQKENLEDAGFKLLADSASCEVEAVKHKTNPFYGVQFHPERITIEKQTHPEGHKVIENFYVNVVKRF
jgi:anthranilate/para-aminobenzoate synthase component II